MFKKLIIGLLLVTGIASAALVDTDRALVDQVKNILENPGFENGKARWTASGGTFTVSSTGKAFGAAGALWDSSSASQTLLSTAVTIPEGLKAKNAVVSCSVKAVSGTATHKLQAYDGTNVVAESVITSSTASFVRTSVNFVSPSSGTLSARIISVAADEPQVYVDDCVVGLADGFNLSQVNQAQFVGSSFFAVTGSCDWNRANTAIGSFTTNSSCPGPTVEFSELGTWATTDTDLPKQTITNLPPGNYAVYVTGFGSNSGGTGTVALAISDGTTTSGRGGYSGVSSSIDGFALVGMFKYTSAGDRTFEVQGSVSANSLNILNSAANQRLHFAIYRYPSSGEMAFRPELTNSYWSGYHANDCNMARTNTAFGDHTADASCTFTQRQNVNFGSVTSALSGSDKLPGIVFTPKVSGSYWVCAFPVIQAASGQYSYQLIDENAVVIATANPKPGAGSESVPPICGIVVASSTAAKTLKIQTKAASGANTIIGSETSIEWNIFQITQSIPTPILVGSVTSNTTGAERIERGLITATCSSSPCTIASQSGAWLTSVTRVSTGIYRANIAAGIFSDIPTCVVIGENLHIAINNPQTAILYEYATYNATNTLTDVGRMNIICMGPK